jgi:trk system potassium uptake protein TrkH
MAATFLHVNILLVRGVMHPMRTIVLGFATVIVGGALLLSLPVSSHEVMFPHPMTKFVGHLFTATSAVCVTGLTVHDTGTYYTPFGQFVIMVLFQLGGLGIVIFGTMFAILVGRQVTLRETSLMQDLYSEQAMGQIRQIIAFIVISTFAIEAFGAAMIYPMWSEMGLTTSQQIFWSVFYSISAFCNAGFALQSDNLVRHDTLWQTHLIFPMLIIIGGIGFPVQWNVMQVARYRVAKLFRRVKPTVDLDQHRVIRLTLHSKVAIVTSAVLIFVGAVLIFLLEIPTEKRFYGPRTDYEDQAVRVDSTIRSHPAGQRFLDAWFLSVASRTAGFNTVDMAPGSLRPTTHLVLIATMFIGGSPASTGGGIKTITFAVIVAAVVAMLRQRPNIEMFKRTIDPIHIRRAVVLVTLFGLLIWMISLLLMLSHPQMNYLEVLFESTSACATVGLSTGVTPSFNTFGRLCLIFGMFAGRVGPLTLLLAVAQSARPTRHEYPTEGMTLG